MIVKTNMNTYAFIVEIETADTKELKRVFKNKAKIRKTKKRLNPYYSYDEEFEWFCGRPIYQMKSDLDLDTIKELLKTGLDLHYVSNSIVQVFSTATTIVRGIVCKKCNATLPDMTMAEHLDVNCPKNKMCRCILAEK